MNRPSSFPLRYRIPTWAVLIFILFLSGCGKPATYEGVKKIEGKTWQSSDTLSFSFPMKDTVNPYNFYLKIRNNTDYPFRNLYLFVEMEFPNGRARLDTVQCFLADKKGRWLGSGLGDVIDNEIIYKYNRRFPLNGEYQFHITHAMRREDLPGILDVGIGVKQKEEQ